LWQAKTGGAEDTLLNIAMDCYKAQHENTARKLQALIMGEIDYLDVLQDSLERRFLASSIVRNFRASTLEGEWIEIKTGWGDELVTTLVNDPDELGYTYDTFSSSGNTCTLVKTQTSTEAKAGQKTLDVTSGDKYKLEATITGTGTIPDVIFGGTTKSDLALGFNVWLVDCSVTSPTHIAYIENASAEVFNGTLTLSIKEISYGA
jgi:hypothetical protein